jgi:hypothetical protein
MNKNKFERIIKLKTDLKEIQYKVSQLETVFNNLVEAHREGKTPSSQFTIRHFMRGDLS